MLIMWREVIKNNPNSKALVEVKCSQKLWDELEKLGAKPEFVRTGNPYIKAKMKEITLIFMSFSHTEVELSRRIK